MAPRSRPTPSATGSALLPQSLKRIIARASVEEDAFLGEDRVRFKVHLDATQLSHSVETTEDLEPYFQSLRSFLEHYGHVCVSGGMSVYDSDDHGRDLGPCIDVEVRGTIAELKGLAEGMTPKKGRAR